MVEGASTRYAALRSAAWRIGIAALGVVGFWVVASDADWFLDWPFYYRGTLWNDNLLASKARGLSLFETVMSATAFVFALPVVIVGAYAISQRGRDARRALTLPFDATPNAFPVLAALVAAAGSAFVSFGLVQGATLLDDERAYVFEARLFARGVVTLPAVPAALANPMMITHPVWTSKYPPGNSLLLAVGVMLGDERVIPPLLAAIMVVAIYVFVVTAFGRHQAMLAAGLACVSPFVWAQYGTVMSFGASACALAVFLAGLARAAKSKSVGAASVAGLALGWIAITRPQDCVALASPAVVMLLVHAVRGYPSARTRAVTVIAAATLVGLVLLAHDRIVTGSFFRYPWMLADPARLGFRRVFPIGPYAHSLSAAFSNVVTAVFRLDGWLFGWPGGILLVVVGLTRASTPFDRLLRFMLGSFFLLMMLVGNTGAWECGPSYYFVMVPILIPLAVRGLRGLVGFAEATDQHVVARTLSWLPVVGAAVCWCTTGPAHLISIAALSREIRAPWEYIADNIRGDAIVMLAERFPAGFSLGYPYTIATGPGTEAKLCQPKSAAEAREAVAFLGSNLPLFMLRIDEARFERDGRRVYTLVPTSP
jgi:hypothetical protein